MDKIKVFIVDTDKALRNKIGEIFSNVEYILLAGEAESAAMAIEQIARSSVDVLLIGAVEEGDTYIAAEKFFLEFPETSIIILEDSLQEENMHKAFFTGANDIVIKPIVPSKLVDSIYKANQYMKTKVLVNKDNISKKRKKSGLGQVFTIFGTKGGIGKTFIAVNLAVSLAKLTGKRVCLVDLDLDFGNVALALNLLPKFTVADVVDDIKNIDQDFIENFLVPHESGIKILPANSQPMENEFINADDIDIILRTLQSVFDYVVIDMTSRFYKPVNPAFAIADKLLVITTPEMASIRNIKAALVTLNEVNYPRSKVRIVLNKMDKYNSIKLKDVETTLNYDVFASIRADYKEAISSMNLGIPTVTKKSSGPLSKDIYNLAKKLVYTSDEKKHK